MSSPPIKDSEQVLPYLTYLAKDLQQGSWKSFFLKKGFPLWCLFVCLYAVSLTVAPSHLFSVTQKALGGAALLILCFHGLFSLAYNKYLEQKKVIFDGIACLGRHSPSMGIKPWLASISASFMFVSMKMPYSTGYMLIEESALLVVAVLLSIVEGTVFLCWTLMFVTGADAHSVPIKEGLVIATQVEDNQVKLTFNSEGSSFEALMTNNSSDNIMVSAFERAKALKPGDSATILAIPGAPVILNTFSLKSIGAPNENV